MPYADALSRPYGLAERGGDLGRVVYARQSPGGLYLPADGRLIQRPTPRQIEAFAPASRITKRNRSQITGSGTTPWKAAHDGTRWFILHSYGSGSGGNGFHSADGITWTATSIHGAGYITFDNGEMLPDPDGVPGTFYVCQHNGSNHFVGTYVNYAGSAATGALGGGGPYDIKWDNKRSVFVIAHLGGRITTSSKAELASSSVNVRVNTFTGNFYSLATNGDIWVAIGDISGPTCYTAEDPTGTWTARGSVFSDVTSTLVKVIWTGKVFVALPGVGTGGSYTSPDGITWTKGPNLYSGSISSVFMLGPTLVICSYAGTMSGVSFSDDGFSFVSDVATTSFGQTNANVYSGAASRDGLSALVMDQDRMANIVDAIRGVTVPSLPNVVNANGDTVSPYVKVA